MDQITNEVFREEASFQILLMELEGKRLQWLERVKINDIPWAGLLNRKVELQFTQKTI
jgi:hypothetical protein